MSLARSLMNDSFPVDQWRCDDAQRAYYEQIAKAAAPATAPAEVPSAGPVSTLVSQVEAARKRIQQSLRVGADVSEPCTMATSGGGCGDDSDIVSRIEELAQENRQLRKVTDDLQAAVARLERRLEAVERTTPATDVKTTAAPEIVVVSDDNEDEDDFELFGDDDDDEVDDEETQRVKEERIRVYEAKKATKKQVIAKSNVILDIKPWDDETDMAAMEVLVRGITMDGLLWGASKLVPLAYGIKKLQISTVVVDDKVSIDELEELITAFEDVVQSVDIAAFNKI